MTYRKILGLLSVLILILAACAPSTSEPTTESATVGSTTGASTMTPSTGTELATAESTTGASTMVASTATEPAATAAAGETATAPASGAATSTQGVPVTGTDKVSVAPSADYGPSLVDSEGHALYLFMKDTQNGGTSDCSVVDGCTAAWPPLLGTADPIAGEGVDQTLLDTITRDDGTLQITYNGWPLYRFAGDTAPGDTNGQGLEQYNGLWYLVAPDGKAIEKQ